MYDTLHYNKMKRFAYSFMFGAVLWCSAAVQLLAYEPRGGRLEHEGGTDFGSAFIFLLLLAVGAIYSFLKGK